MKISSCVALVCSLAINGFNAFYHQPAGGESLNHINEELSRAERVVMAATTDRWERQDAEIQLAIAGSGAGFDIITREPSAPATSLWTLKPLKDPSINQIITIAKDSDIKLK